MKMTMLKLDRRPPDAIEGYFQHLDLYNRLHNPRTRERYRGHARHWLRYCEKLGFTAPAIDTGDIERYIALRGHEGAAPKTINDELQFLRAAFQYLADRNDLPANPFKPIPRLKVPNKPLRFYTPEQTTALLDAASEKMRDVLRVFLYTGLRKGELLHLEWADVDFDRLLLWVKCKDYWTTKNYTERSIPINDALLPLLRRRRDQYPGYKWVFQGKSGKRLHRNTLQGRMASLGKKTGIEGATIHRLRHTFGATLAMNNISLPKIQKLMGHKDSRTTEIYAVVTGSQLQDEINTLTF
jgi:integrase